MAPSAPNSPQAPSSPTEEPLNIEQALNDAEAALQDLRHRYEQIQTGPATQQQLNHQLETLQQELAQTNDQLKQTQDVHQQSQLRSQQKTLHHEIQTVQESLFNLELELESRIFRWFCRDKQEWFWQFLRYAGIGFGAALLLQNLVGQPDTSNTQTPEKRVIPNRIVP